MTSGTIERGVAYLETSALGKLAWPEAESDALRAELVRWDHRVTSDLTIAELLRAARRRGRVDERAATQLLGKMALHPLRRTLLKEAGRLDPPLLRALDALHLATASVYANHGLAIFTYDRRLSAAARAAGLRVLAPGG